MSQKTVLLFKNIIKNFPGVQALKNVSFELLEGEIHALVGENGAGKSTLIKTCSGAIQPTSGTITVNGAEYSQLNPILSRDIGISVIYQELNLVNDLTVYENIFLGRAIKKGIFIDRNKMIKKSNELFEQLEIKIDPTEYVRNLTVGYQQMVEIAKSISMDSKILIMDEPSASLTKMEQEALFKSIAVLKESKVSIIYISHRLDEIFEISDRVTVLRDGELIKTMRTSDSSRDELIKLMVGRELTETYPARDHHKETEPVLEVENLSGNGLSDVSVKLKKGEILGLGGLIGAGRTEFAEIIFGVEQASSGKIKMNGKEISPKKPSESIALKIALVPEDRKRQGVLLHLSIRDNITIPILKKISKLLVIDSKDEQQICDTYHKSLDIRTPSLMQLVKNLSGGNQQKVVLAKWLAAEPEIIIFDEPTRGIDVGAKQEIYHTMNKLTEEGKSLIMISSDMEELIGVSDRIIVFAEGKITGELQKKDFNQELILDYASMV